MQDAGRSVRDRIGQFAAERPDLMARLRLFGLLILLAPMFAGLQYVLGGGAARVEVRFVPQDVPIVVPVERIVEKVVERVIYVPVPVDETPPAGTASPTPAPGPGGTATPTSSGPSGTGATVAAGPVPGRLTAGAVRTTLIPEPNGAKPAPES